MAAEIRPKPPLLAVSDADWAEAVQRESVLRLLSTQPRVGLSAALAAASGLGPEQAAHLQPAAHLSRQPSHGLAAAPQAWPGPGRAASQRGGRGVGRDGHQGGVPQAGAPDPQGGLAAAEGELPHRRVGPAVHEGVNKRRTGTPLESGCNALTFPARNDRQVGSRPAPAGTLPLRRFSASDHPIQQGPS